MRDHPLKPRKELPREVARSAIESGLQKPLKAVRKLSGRFPEAFKQFSGNISVLLGGSPEAFHEALRISPEGLQKLAGSSPGALRQLPSGSPDALQKLGGRSPGAPKALRELAESSPKT